MCYVYTGEFVTVRTFFLVSLFVLTLQSTAGLAQSVATTSLPTTTASAAMPIPAPPGLAAKSYLLIDYNTGKVIAEHNSNERLPPASLTKMMTAYLVSSEMKFRSLRPDDMVPVSPVSYTHLTLPTTPYV